MSDASLHELLSAWMDGRLTGSEKVRAERLISDDPQCAELVSQWQSQREQIRALPRYRLDSDFSQRVLAKVNLLEDAGRVSRARSQQVVLPPTQEPTSYFATRSALTAITALAAMLLLTLFTLPLRVPKSQVASRPSQPRANEPGSLSQDVGTDSFFAADEETDNSEIAMSRKSGESEKAVDDSRTDNVFANESLVEKPDQLEYKVAKGGAGDELNAETTLSQNGFAKEGRAAASLLGQDPDEVDATKRHLAGSDSATKQVEDLPALEDKIREQEKSESPTLLADNSASAELSGGMSADRSGAGEANLSSLSMYAARGTAARDKDALGIVPALQLATNAVDEVWLIKIAEVPSLKKLEQAMRDNQIAFQTSPVSFGQPSQGAETGELDASVQAIYVLTSPTQMRGAIAMLSGNAEINAFPLSVPELPTDVGRQMARSDQPVDQAGTGTGLSEPALQSRARRSFAQQLPPKPRPTMGFDAVKKLEELKTGQAVTRAAEKMAGAGRESTANKFAGQPNPAAILAPGLKGQGVPGQPQFRPEVSPADTDPTSVDRLAEGQNAAQMGADGNLPWYAEEARKAALRDAEQRAAQQQFATGATAEPESAVGNPVGENAEMQRYLLLIRFDPANVSEAAAVPADADK